MLKFDIFYKQSYNHLSIVSILDRSLTKGRRMGWAAERKINSNVHFSAPDIKNLISFIDVFLLIIGMVLRKACLSKATRPGSPTTTRSPNQTSYFLLPSSFFLLPTSFFQLPTSSFLLPTSNFQLPTSRFQLPASYLLFLIS